uniref:Uncharacterized protein n=1 Tax=Glossina palpalis gambiensis TaxID=67801 RepID=A0A1B0BH74_9MUSC
MFDKSRLRIALDLPVAQESIAYGRTLDYKELSFENVYAILILCINDLHIFKSVQEPLRSPKSLQSSITSSATAAAKASQRNFLPRDEIYIDDEGLEGSGHGGRQKQLLLLVEKQKRTI